MVEQRGTMEFALGMAMATYGFLRHRPGGENQPLPPPRYAVRWENTLYCRLSALERMDTTPNTIILGIGVIQKCEQHGPSSIGPLRPCLDQF